MSDARHRGGAVFPRHDIVVICESSPGLTEVFCKVGTNAGQESHQKQPPGHVKVVFVRLTISTH